MKPSNHAIEDWAKEVQKANKRNLTKDEAKDFLQYCLIEASGGAEKDKETMDMLTEKKAGYSSVIYLRVKYCHTYEISATLAYYLGEQVIKNFGISTMLANYLQFVAHEHNLKRIGMHEWSQFAFPEGIIADDKEWQRLWELQKIESDETTDPKYKNAWGGNGLDRSEFAESILIIGEK